MSSKIIVTERFGRELKRLSKKYASLKSEFLKLIKSLENNPKSGVPIGKECFKIRISIQSKGKGKRGGARVITYFYFEKDTVYLLSIYNKSEKENLKPSELLEMIESLELD